MTYYQRFINNVALRRWTVLGFIVLLLWLMRSMISIVLLTFVFTFLVTRLVQLIRRFVKIPPVVLVILIYLLLVFGLYSGITSYLPKLVTETIKMANTVYDFYRNPSHDTNYVVNFINQYSKRLDIMNQLKNWATVILNYVGYIGEMALTLFFSLILSFFFTVESKRVTDFSRLFLDSTYGWVFQDMAYLFKKFVNTFGVVVEAQFFIAICNTVITTVALAFLKMPQLPTLALMIFILSLIPVAGVIVSIIPLGLIGYSVGGLDTVIYILVLIAVVHMLEAYVLNPQFYASRTELPIFYTFVILLVGERLFGVWGLIFGVPLFTFFLDLLGVKSIGRSRPSIKQLRQRRAAKARDQPTDEK
ncbi:AI-2E family transporter [Furfurilactobacillus entadae]|uniref:AI-2E family transporter n=1 Tax=Furfurilactobacillus entadae TaxID=2922307 RepID=UPI0035EDA893